MARVPSGTFANLVGTPVDRVHGVQQRLGREALDAVMAVKAAVGGVARRRPRVELVQPRVHDRPQQVLDVEAALDEVVGQGVQQRRVARRVGGAHVVDRLDQAAAEQVGDVAVDDVAGEEAVVRRGQPVGQRLPAVARLGDRLAVQRRRLHDLAGARVADLAVRSGPATTVSLPKTPNSWLVLVPTRAKKAAKP